MYTFLSVNSGENYEWKSKYKTPTEYSKHHHIPYFYLGIGLSIGVGGSVICGQRLGAKEKLKSSELFSQTFVTAAVVCTLLSLTVCYK